MDIRQEWTSKFLQNLKPEHITAIYTRPKSGEPKPIKLPFKLPDPSNPGLVLQVTPAGKKTFFYRYKNRQTKKQEFWCLGEFTFQASGDKVTLKQARDEYERVKGIYNREKKNPRDYFAELDIQEHSRQAREQQEREKEAAQGSIGQLCELKIAELDKTNSPSADHYRHAFKKDVYPVVGRDTKAKNITPSDIRNILAPIIQRGALTKAQRVRSYLSATYKFGIEFDYDPANAYESVRFGIEHNPVRDVPNPLKNPTVGERTLRESEIKTFWENLSDLSIFSVPTEICIKLLFATGGQRVKEVLHASWAEFDIDGRIWTVPRLRTKNRKREHVVPLTGLAIEQLKRLQDYQQQYRIESQFLFPKRVPREKTDPNVKPDTHSRIKADMISSEPMPIESIGQAVYRFLKKNPEFEKFVPRDIRRTCKTLMAKNGIDREIRKRIHNHALTDIDEKHYDKHDYLLEKITALQKWERIFNSILKGDIQRKDNVVSMAG